MIQKLFAQSAFLRFAFCTCATMTGMQSPLFCQRVKWEISGTTEGLWNITDGKTGWCNLLEVSAETGLWKNAQLETAAISTYNLGIPVAGDLQAFSCIDAGPDKAFRLIEAGIRQNIGDKGSVYAGLRNIDMDHFTTPFTALFTNASHGNFPILSANFPLATYPLAALCLHTEFSPLPGLAKASTTAWPATVSTVSSVSAPVATGCSTSAACPTTSAKKTAIMDITP